MCLPALGAIGAVASIAGSAVSAMGAKSQSDAQANQMEYNATVSRINARTERQKGMVEQENLDLKYDKSRGEALAAAGASGVDPNYGSAALTIFGEQAFHKALDKNTAYVNAETAAVGNENKARDLDAQAKATRKAGGMSAAGSFLSGVAGGIKAFGGGGSGALSPTTVGGGEGW